MRTGAFSGFPCFFFSPELHQIGNLLQIQVAADTCAAIHVPITLSRNVFTMLLCWLVCLSVAAVEQISYCPLRSFNEFFVLKGMNCGWPGWMPGLGSEWRLGTHPGPEHIRWCLMTVCGTFTDLITSKNTGVDIAAKCAVVRNRASRGNYVPPKISRKFRSDASQWELFSIVCQLFAIVTLLFKKYPRRLGLGWCWPFGSARCPWYGRVFEELRLPL